MRRMRDNGKAENAMQSANIKGKRRPFTAFVACAITLALVVAFVPLSKASAYCDSDAAGLVG